MHTKYFFFTFSLLHKLPRSDRSTLFFFKAHITPVENDPIHVDGRKLSVNTQYGSTKPHVNSLFMEFVLLLASDAFPCQDKISGLSLNDKNQLEFWIQPPSQHLDTIKQFISDHVITIMSEISDKRVNPTFDDKPLKIQSRKS